VLNKFLAALAAVFTLMLGTPVASAADIPILTWEKGKEHNIVLGGNGIVKDWAIQLKSEAGSPLRFKQSREDERGFVVFSVAIPSSYPSGIYTVETNSEQEGSKIVAGVRIIEISDYNLIQIPTKLFIILFTLIILISTLSMLRMQKYERIEYLRGKLAAAPGGPVGFLYRFRESSIEEIHRSIFKFQLIREGELLYKFSPSAWAVLPWVALGLGALVSANERLIQGVQLTPVLFYAGIAVIGLLDPFSGFMAGVGFAVVHCVTGDVSTVRAAMSLVAISVGWFAPGLISSLYSDALNKDSYPLFVKRFLPDLLASAIGGLVFFSAQLLTNSFADHPVPISASGYLVPAIFSFLVFARIQAEKWLNKDLHQTGENYQIRVLQLPRVISPRTILLAAGYFAAAIYVWTESWDYALKTALILAVPMLILMVRFENPVVPFLRKLDRHIFVETTVLLVIAFILFNYIQSLPIEVTQKGRMFISYTVVLLLIHGFYSSVCDSSNREKEKRELELTA
jgi:hypothetical protein